MTSEIIRFGEAVDKGLGEGKVFPFVYGFVPPSTYLGDGVFLGDQYEPHKTEPIATLLPYLGIPVNPGATLTYPRQLDGDYHFRLVSIRYTVLALNRGNTGAIKYDPASVNVIADQWNDNQGVPLTRYVDVSISLPSIQGRYLYGGDSTNRMQAPDDLLPISLDTLQGVTGQGQLRTPVYMARESTIMFKFTNRYDIPVVVNGALIGVKVRI